MTLKEKRAVFDFSKKYDDKFALEHFDTSEHGLWRKLINWRDQQMARKALQLAGSPKSILDVPCGTGRLWNVLTEDESRLVHVSDYSQSMIDAGLANRAQKVTNRIKPFQASAFALPVPSNFVDNIFCIHFMHRLSSSADRKKLLKEFHRVTKDTVIISLWVDGNLKSRWCKARGGHHEPQTPQRQFIIPALVIEDEFNANGFRVVERLDFMKYYHMSRTYILRKA